MSRAENICLTVTALFIVMLFLLIATSELVLAADPATTQAQPSAGQAVQCPNVGQPCKVLILTPQEEDMLTKQGGILDSAAAGRYIDLGNVAAYFRMKLMQAPAGEIKAPPQPTSAPKTEEPAKPAQ